MSYGSFGQVASHELTVSYYKFYGFPSNLFYSTLLTRQGDYTTKMVNSRSGGRTLRARDSMFDKSVSPNNIHVSMTHMNLLFGADTAAKHIRLTMAKVAKYTWMYVFMFSRWVTQWLIISLGQFVCPRSGVRLKVLTLHYRTSGENIGDSGIIQAYRAWKAQFHTSYASGKEYILPGLNYTRQVDRVSPMFTTY